MHLTVVTNWPPVARALGSNAHCRTILCPGDYVAREEGVFGAEAVDFIRRFKANKAFIGAGGVTLGRRDRRRFARLLDQARDDGAADRTILLVDSSKFDLVAVRARVRAGRHRRARFRSGSAFEAAAGSKRAGVQVTLAKA